MQENRLMKVPIAETFHSLQGEGVWVGTPMHFIRLAGCSVGKLTTYIPPRPGTNIPSREVTDPKNSTPFPAPLLKTGAQAWLCHTWDNRPFWCDTDFNKHLELDTDDLVTDTYEKHMCVTGGEPMIHPRAVTELLNACRRKHIMLHIETSGTIFVNPSEMHWVSVSPKTGCLPTMLECADEIKLLVDHDFDINTVPKVLFERENVFLQPINHEIKVDPLTLAKVFELLRLYPQWRLSVQLHKLLEIP
jgi:organic radical activating enzyme